MGCKLIVRLPPEGLTRGSRSLATDRGGCHGLGLLDAAIGCRWTTTQGPGNRGWRCGVTPCAPPLPRFMVPPHQPPHRQARLARPPPTPAPGRSPPTLPPCPAFMPPPHHSFQALLAPRCCRRARHRPAEGGFPRTTTPNRSVTCGCSEQIPFRFDELSSVQSNLFEFSSN